MAFLFGPYQFTSNPILLTAREATRCCHYELVAETLEQSPWAPLLQKEIVAFKGFVTTELYSVEAPVTIVSTGNKQPAVARPTHA